MGTVQRKLRNAWERGWTEPGEEGGRQLRSPENHWPESSSIRFQRKHTFICVLGFSGKPCIAVHIFSNFTDGEFQKGSGVPRAPALFPQLHELRLPVRALLPENRRGLGGPGNAETVALDLLPCFPACCPRLWGRCSQGGMTSQGSGWKVSLPGSSLLKIALVASQMESHSQWVSDFHYGTCETM